MDRFEKKNGVKMKNSLKDNSLFLNCNAFSFLAYAFIFMTVIRDEI